MRALFLTRYGGPEVLEVRELPLPRPQVGQLRIRTQWAGLNFADVAARVGLYLDAPKPPTVLGYEVMGQVDALGPSTQGFEVGQNVVALTQFGAHAEYVCVDAIQALPLPPGVVDTEAAAMPVNYLTAYHMLFHVAGLKPHSRLLVHMAAGGVGVAALQLSRLVEGVEVFATASASKHAFVRQHGAAHCIDYRTENYVERIRELTHGEGVELILDPLGGADWHKGYGLLRPTGHLVAYGWSNAVSGARRNMFRVAWQFLSSRRYFPFQMMNDNRSLSGVNIGRLWSSPHLMRQHMDALMQLLAQGKIHPQVDRIFPLEQAAEAHRYMQARANKGKLLLACAPAQAP